MNNYLVAICIALFIIGCNGEKKNTTATLNAIPSPATEFSGQPYLFTDARDNVFLSWIEKREEQSTLRFSQLQKGDWVAPQTVASGQNWFVNWADYPMLAVNNNNLVAHFLSKNGTKRSVYDINFTYSQDKGASWSTPTTLHDDGKEAEHGFVSLVPYQENFLVVWLDGRNAAMKGMDHHEGHHGEMSLRAAVITNQGSKIKEWELDKRTCDCCQTSAAITANGPVAVYRDRSDDEIRDISIVRLLDSVWTEPKAIYQDNWKIAGCPVNGPRIVARDKTVAVAWFTMAEDKLEVKVIFSNDSGETFGTPISLGEGNPIGRVDIVLLDADRAAVSWMEGPIIKASIVHADGTKEPSMTIATSSEARSSGFPQMALSGNELIFAWTNTEKKSIEIASLSLTN